MKKHIITLALAIMGTVPTFAQRTTDKLERGLVAVPCSDGGQLVSWRIYGEEYYDVTYNLYRNGTKIASELKVSDYNDKSGNSSSQYQVAAVVRGVEQEKCEAVKPWTTDDGNNNKYWPIKVQGITDRAGANATADYQLNDVSLADLDGDGRAEFIVKRPCGVATDTNQKNRFHVIDCYDWNGNRLWWIDLGPNMQAEADEQWDAVAYDWDGDGRAEVLMRGADNMIIHHADGTTTNIGNMNTDHRANGGLPYCSVGNEYLLYLEGQTAKPYQIGPSAHPDYMVYPLERGQDSDWGTGIVGHRSTKHFFGAPFLDGRKASIFLGRGIYTKEKMAAYDVDPITHALTQRWYWECNVGGPWFGQGYHNYAIADVDWDGRDEIVYGSMVIDDNGKGLSTTGLGHGDAQHCSDLDPYRHGQEQFACNETSPNMNFRNATTSEFYYRSVGTGDDGRALCGNFTNAHPGCVGRSTNTGMVSCVADKVISELGDLIAWNDLNFRIYWDGDLCEEVVNSPGTERDAVVIKPGTGRIFQSSGVKMCNWSKNNPCGMGDIIGDWREELILRNGDNTELRVYTTPYYTKYRNYTLWHDHQYRQGMVWACLGYNQPPHASYFLGEMEGITIAPPPFTMTGRTEVANGGTITAEDKHFIVCETADTKVSIADGASPYMVTFNVPSWVQGTGASNSTVARPAIKRDYYTCEVTGGALTGATRVVKQGDGILTLPKVDMTYTGETNVWAGTLNFDGTMKRSDLWLNRFAELNSNGGTFKSIKADYASVIRPGGADNKGSITVNEELKLGFGSRIVLDLYDDMTCDQINVGKLLSIETKKWKYGPAYMRPVFQFVLHGEAKEGRYDLGHIGGLEDDLANIIIEGADSKMKNVLVLEDGHLYLMVEGTRSNTAIAWNGANGSEWNVAAAENFSIGQESGQIYVNGDDVTFGDDASTYKVTISQSIEPASVTFDNSKAYTLSGTGSLDGTMSLTKQGTGGLVIQTDNSYTGGNHLNGGSVTVSSLAFSTQAKGNLGAVTTTPAKFTMSGGAILNTTAAVTQGSAMKMEGEKGGVVNNAADFKTEAAISGTILTKRGNGWFFSYNANSALDTVRVEAGTFVIHGHSTPARNIVLAGGTVTDDQCQSATPLKSIKGKKSTFNMGASGNRTNYTNKLTGEGEVTMHIGKHPNYDGVYRTAVQMDWSKFEGTVVLSTVNEKNAFPLDNSAGIAKGTLNVGATVTVLNTGKTFKIGALTGTGALGGPVLFAQGAASGTNTWQAGALGTDFTFGGKIIDNSVFDKVGEGTMTVSGTWTNTGKVTISAGAIKLNNNKATAGMLGTGALTIKGTLCGQGTLGNSTVTLSKGGTIRPGNTETALSGEIKLGGKNLTANAGSTLQFCVASKTKHTTLSGIGTLNVKGTIKVVLGGAASLNDGDEIQLFQCASYADASAPEFDLPTYFQNNSGTEYWMEWDTTRIAEGILTLHLVDAPDGIEQIVNCQLSNRQLYDLQGHRITTPQAGRIYIVGGKKVLVK